MAILQPSFVSGMGMRRIKIFNAVGGPGAPEYWTAWVAELTRAGFEVEEVFAVSWHAYRAARGRAARLRLRWLMYVGTGLRVLRVALFDRGDSLLIATTNPFYAPWLLATFAGKRSKVVNLLYDLYPDALVVAGSIKATGLVARFLARMTGAALRKCHATVFLGRTIAQHAIQQYGRPFVSWVIPVGADCRCFPNPPESGITLPLDVFYCGNLGVLHETETLLKGLCAVDESTRESVRFLFHASGPCARDFAQSVRDYGLAGCFTFAGPLDSQAWIERMRRVPIGLVLLKEEARFSAVPSKVYSAMAAGQAILAVCPRTSDLAGIVVDNDCGWVVDPGDKTALAGTLKRIAQDPVSIAEKREHAFLAAHQRFCMPVVAQQWIELINTLS